MATAALFAASDPQDGARNALDLLLRVPQSALQRPRITSAETLPDLEQELLSALESRDREETALRRELAMARMLRTPKPAASRAAALVALAESQDATMRVLRLQGATTALTASVRLRAHGALASAIWRWWAVACGAPSDATTQPCPPRAPQSAQIPLLHAPPRPLPLPPPSAVRIDTPAAAFAARTGTLARNSGTRRLRGSAHVPTGSIGSSGSGSGFGSDTSRSQASSISSEWLSRKAVLAHHQAHPGGEAGIIPMHKRAPVPLPAGRAKGRGGSAGKARPGATKAGSAAAERSVSSAVRRSGGVRGVGAGSAAAPRQAG